MSTRRPLQPLSPPAANIAGIEHIYASTAKATDGIARMQTQYQNDTQGSGSIVSGLTSLENENEADDFDKMMIQAMRDDQRLKNATHGKIQPFRKARAHPRVGLTMENLERNDAWNSVARSANGSLGFDRPESSNGSARSDPAIHAPPQWGRKGRIDRNWLKRIKTEDESYGTQDDTIDRFVPDSDATPRHASDADVPRNSIEDSPLSHKSPLHGTPAPARHDRIEEDWDITMDLNEASLIASTPYIPRNTALDDIRQREIESLREQAVATSRLDRIRETSPEEARRPRSSSKSTNTQTNGILTTTDPASGEDMSPGSRFRKRTNVWSSPGKSKAVTGSGVENSPIVVYKKSSETLGMVDPGLLANAQKSSTRPTHRREDSRDLLRHLARVSSTPSPGRTMGLRPQTAPAGPTESSSQATGIKSPILLSTTRELAADIPARESTTDIVTTAPELQRPSTDDIRIPETFPEAAQELQTGGIDATPMPVERSVLNPKTPVVTGAWIDTPGPRTAARSADASQPEPRSSRKVNFDDSIPEETQSTPPEEAPEVVPLRAIRPKLPGSALQAIVEKAKANQRTHPDDFGDSTINSLEELITPLEGNPESGELEEDTLQGLELPTEKPRNEAERQRYQELLHLHRMNERLRATRTGVRDATRGMKRVENRVEHMEEAVTEGGEKVKVVYRDCPCTANGHHYDFSMWRLFTNLFYNSRLKTKRQGTVWRFCGGLSAFSILIICLFTWRVSEEVACELWGNPMYATRSPYPFAVNMGAPVFPYVIPTLIYRNLIRGWWLPLYGAFSWVLSVISALIFGVAEHSTKVASGTMPPVKSNIWTAHSSQIAEELELDLSMMNDEIMK